MWAQDSVRCFRVASRFQLVCIYLYIALRCVRIENRISVVHTARAHSRARVNWESVRDLRAYVRHRQSAHRTSHIKWQCRDLRRERGRGSQCTNCVNGKNYRKNARKWNRCQIETKMNKSEFQCVFVSLLCLSPQMRKVKEKSMKRATISSSAMRQMKKSTAIARPVIELPTTEPDFDCYGTVSELDDECDCDEAAGRHNLSAAAIGSAKIARTPQRQLQLNLAEQKMPPELTVTGAQQQQKSSDELIAVAEINRCSDKSLVSELPSIGRAKRHFSWHSIKKCVR